MLRLSQFNRWEASFGLEASSLPELWALLSHIATNDRFMFNVESTEGAFESFALTFDGSVMWAMRHDFRNDPVWYVYGGTVDVEYTNEYMTFVQVEFPDEVQEDPPPSHWWLPTALGFPLDQAKSVVEQLISGGDVEHTTIQMEPSSARYTYPEGF